MVTYQKAYLVKKQFSITCILLVFIFSAGYLISTKNKQAILLAPRDFSLIQPVQVGGWRSSFVNSGDTVAVDYYQVYNRHKRSGRTYSADETAGTHTEYIVSSFSYVQNTPRYLPAVIQ